MKKNSIYKKKHFEQYLCTISHANRRSEKRKATKSASRELPYYIIEEPRFPSLADIRAVFVGSNPKQGLVTLVVGNET
jgi:hypothetical protein